MSATASTDRGPVATGSAGVTAAAFAFTLIGFPLALNWCIRTQRPDIGAALACLVCLVLLAVIGARRVAAALAIGIAAAALIAMIAGVERDTLADIGRAVIFAPSVLVTLAVAALFGRTLRAGQTPLLTRLATQARGTLPPRATTYTRAITWMWTLLLLGLGLTAAILGLWAPFEIWSAFTNGINHAIVSLAFVGEYLFRRWWLRDMHHPGFFEYVSFVRRARGTVAGPSDTA